MKRSHFMALDTHCTFCELVAVTSMGRILYREHCPTTIPALVAAIQKVPRPRRLTFEEGPLADWLKRNLQSCVDELVVCDPRRNQLIAKESDKDDPIDAGKLAQLYRGGYLKEVHHPESVERVVFKQHIALYADRVRQRVREANRILSQFRCWGFFLRESAFLDPAKRLALLQPLPFDQVREDIELLFTSYDAVSAQIAKLRKSLLRLGRQEPQVRRFTKVPGVKWIRAAQFFAYLDTPWRFRSKAALWRYLGVGLGRRHSGEGPVFLGVAQNANRVLKGVILGAAKSAIAQGKNPFADQYQKWVQDGLSPRNARRNVARSLAAVLWGMWKTGSEYRPEWVGQAQAAVRASR